MMNTNNQPKAAKKLTINKETIRLLSSLHSASPGGTTTRDSNCC